ncbi:MAG TPA: DUF1302 family protein, partial [Steroidobacteraceae bacterium]|nr:DUF1302 family protein [Steroidobacteraceae bacterium]
MNIHSRLPVIAGTTATTFNDLTPVQQGALQAFGLGGTDAWGGYFKSSPTSALLYRTVVPAVAAGLNANFAATGLNLQSTSGYWEYPEDIQVFGLSAATNLFGWSASAEVSYQQDVPVMINGNALLAAVCLGVGPAQERVQTDAAKPGGSYYSGWDRFNKTQLQANVVKTFSNIFGAQNMLIVGEVGAQWNDVPDYTKGGLRYGRGFMFGTGGGPGFTEPTDNPLGAQIGAASGGNACSPTFVNLPVPVANQIYNTQPNGCRNDGYVTDVSWGYRLRASLDYNNVMNSGVTLTPSVYWAHDVSGVSMDPTFNEGRKTLGLGLKATYNKRYTFDLSYVSYDNHNFDGLFDRDFYSAAVGMTF